MRRARNATKLLASAVFLCTVAIGLAPPDASVATPAAPTCGDSSRPDGAVAVGGRGGSGIRPALCLQVRNHDIDGSPLVTANTPSGYTPATIRAYLGLSGDGSGQTIAIVDAYDHPNIAADLAAFDAAFGLPPPPKFTKVTQSGATRSYPATNANWALEIALDVEWAHAVAPAASILLVEAKSATFTDMDAAIAYAAKQSSVRVVSNSWGAPEFSGQTRLDSYCKLTKALCVFSTGDDGNPGSYPAYSPYVLSVGGTTLNLTTGVDGSVAVADETTWAWTGGGVSAYEPKPAYQTAVNPYATRGTADVSYDADPATGFAVYDSIPYDNQSGWFQMGGTSAGAPQWAAIIAVADQLRKAGGKRPLAAVTSSSGLSAHTTIYSLTRGLADITTGSANGTCGTVCSAGVGYDFLTGLGSPRPGIDTALAVTP